MSGLLLIAHLCLPLLYDTPQPYEIPSTYSQVSFLERGVNYSAKIEKAGMFRRPTHASSSFVLPLNFLVLFAYIDAHWTEDLLELHDSCPGKDDL